MKYTCECCNYTTQRKFNYDKHMTSNKHKLVKGTVHDADVSLETSTVTNCQMNELKLIMERLDKHQKQLNEHTSQIQNIISEIF
jgi:hypothetical protein